MAKRERKCHPHSPKGLLQNLGAGGPGLAYGEKGKGCSPFTGRWVPGWNEMSFLLPAASSLFGKRERLLQKELPVTSF